MRPGITTASALTATLLAATAGAHEVGLSRGEYLVEGAAVEARLIFARKELVALVAGLDRDHDGALTSAEVAAARGALDGALVQRVRVTGDGAACPGTLERAELAEQDGISVGAVYRCPRRPRQIGVTLALLDDLPFGHRHLARASAGAAALDRVLSQRSPSLSLDVPAGATLSGDASGATPPGHGARDVLARCEGPAFLLALLVTCVSRRAAALTAAAFVLAIAFGFTLGTRALFMPSPRVLGAALALSLVYAGIDALTSPDGRRRWRVALPFGVVHGLGYAKTSSSAPWTGAGVAGALATVSAVLLAVVLWPRWRPLLKARGAMALGALIAALGVFGLIYNGP